MTSTSVGVLNISKIHRIKCDAPNGNKHVVFGVYIWEQKYNAKKYTCYNPKWAIFRICSVMLNFVT